MSHLGLASQHAARRSGSLSPCNHADIASSPELLLRRHQNGRVGLDPRSSLRSRRDSLRSLLHRRLSPDLSLPHRPSSLLHRRRARARHASPRSPDPLLQHASLRAAGSRLWPPSYDAGRRAGADHRGPARSSQSLLRAPRDSQRRRGARRLGRRGGRGGSPAFSASCSTDTPSSRFLSSTRSSCPTSSTAATPPEPQETASSRCW